MNWRDIERRDEEGWHVRAVSGSIANRPALSMSPYCGCFHCKRILAFRDIREWTDAPYGTSPDKYNETGDTALCPHCGFDTVIGSASGFSVTEALLEQMHAYWFAPGPDYEFVQRTRPQPEAHDPVDTEEPVMHEDNTRSIRTATGDHIDAHKASFKNRDSIERSTHCGCFHCVRIFEPEDITDWWDSPEGTPHFLDNALGLTATCPHCGIDSVIGSASGYPITTEFLLRMYHAWF
ncbi:hypothetical protein [Castellaniella sp.]|uniref:hypothetical protein n=1 Tax=Castellaniella sp. TaxID=1955812 RepID=UPI00355F41DC